MKREAVTLSALLTIGVTFLSLGIDLIKLGQVVEGVICAVVGFGIICLGVYLFQLGLIDRFKQFAEARKRGRPRKERPR
ncbi:MAG: hypothetical protein ACXQTR_06555 [Candidatus Methanospirareceae archaeon]